MPRTPLLLLALAAAGAAEPARHLRYAESGNRLVYAFVFGHTDTCRVIRRPAPPRLDFFALVRRPPGADWRGHPDETLVAEFSFGRSGRPVHLVPTNEARFLVGFANRAPGGGRPAQDVVASLEQRVIVGEPLDYAALPVEPAPDWPALDRVLPHKEPDDERPPEPLHYAFLEREPAPGRLLVARWSEGDGVFVEMVCFAVDLAARRATLPEEAELRDALADKDEALWRAGAAWAYGQRGERDALGALRAALGRTELGAARAEIARAMVRCGSDGARRTLRALLGEEKDPGARRNAALALATLPPDRSDADALAAALTDPDPETARLAGIAAARLGTGAVNDLLRLSRSRRVETRLAAVRVLGRLDDATAERRLLELAADREESVQTAAAIALTAPPRAILAENREEFGRALAACAKRGNASAARRLSLLAAHAELRHEAVYEGLVACAPLEPRAVWALSRLTGERLADPEACARWWKSRER